MDNKKSLGQRINEEMGVSYANSLEKNFDLAKKFIRITPEGKVDVQLKDRLIGKEQILLYLVGKLYAKEAGKTIDDDVGNEELIGVLGIKVGSLLPWLKDLRDSDIIKSVKKGRHFIQISNIEKILNNIENKNKKRTKSDYKS